MWRLLSTFSRLGLTKTSRLHVRTFLSDSFRLENSWSDRLSSPILKKINVNDMFYELDNRFQHFANASALDIDLFVNAVNDELNFDEVEDVVHKLRLSPEAVNILPSTQHALIRLYLKFKKTKDLIRILDDRLNYGIFADDYCTLLILDEFIKEGNFRDAAKVSSFCMLQEDMSNPLIKYMSLYACHKYLENPIQWNDEENITKEEEEDDEVVKVRVRYIRNLYFDDHFDLVEPNHLIGKTFEFVGTEIDDHIGRTYKLVGLILHEKYDQASQYLKTSNEKRSFVKDGLLLVQTILDEQSKVESNAKFIPRFQELTKLIGEQEVTEGNLLTMVQDRLNDLVSKLENSEMNKQLEIYKQWETTRDKLVLDQIAKITREKQLAEVERQKELLKSKEEELFFFENQDKLDLIIEEKEKRKEEQIERERQMMEARRPKKKDAVIKRKVPVNPPLDQFIDENIPMKLIKTKL